MGLGKTAQSISTLEFQRQLCDISGPFLIIAPLTTLGHWQREVQTWTSMVGLLTHVACRRLALLSVARSQACDSPVVTAIFTRILSCKRCDLVTNTFIDISALDLSHMLVILQLVQYFM